MRPALATIQDGQCPARVMDELAPNCLPILMPASSAPMSGVLAIFASDRVTLRDKRRCPASRRSLPGGLGFARPLRGPDAATASAAHARRSD
jgi:hypothetical protein